MAVRMSISSAKRMGVVKLQMINIIKFKKLEEGFPAFNSHGKLISVKPFVSEIAQLEVIHIIDRGQSYEQMTQEIKTKKLKTNKI